MGTYISTVVEILGPDGWRESEQEVFPNDQSESPKLTQRAFNWQQYIMFSLFADVRTQDHGVVPIAPNRGLPENASDSALEEILGGWGAHGWLYPGRSEDEFKTVDQKVANRNCDEAYGFSWLTAGELLAVDYDARITSMENPQKTEMLRDALGDRYFENLDQLTRLGSPDQVRILFCFTG